MRLIGYLRVSTEEQADSGLGLEAQRSRIEGWAASQGEEIVEWVTDAGVSGVTSPERRPGLGGVLARLNRKRGREVDGLVVAKLDRLGRSTRDILRLVDDAASAGWRLACCAESLDTHTAVGRFLVTILSGLAQMERDLISERTKDALKALRARGRSAGRYTPWGWRTEDGEFESRKGDERPLIPWQGETWLIDYMRAQRNCGHSFADIAADLEMGDVANPRTGECRWTANRVAKILASAERRQTA